MDDATFTFYGPTKNHQFAKFNFSLPREYVEHLLKKGSLTVAKEDLADLFLSDAPIKYKKPLLLHKVSKNSNFKIELSEDTPDWLSERIHRYMETIFIATVVKDVQDREWTEKIDEAASEFSVTLERIMAVLKENPSEATLECLDILLARAGYDLYQAVLNALPAWKRERDGVKRGHAAKDFNWMNELDNQPEWMEQKLRGKSMGWKVSSTFIVNKILRSDGCPQDYLLHPSTVTRERNRRRKAAITSPK